jgi:hypothetical protein
VLKAAIDVGSLYSSEHANFCSTHSKPTTVAPTHASSLSALTAGSKALDIWNKKLAFLLAEEAKTADAEQKFSIQQRIEEARAKIQEFGGQFQ